MVRPSMANEIAIRARRSDIWIWALVVAATVSVVALAIIQGNRSAPRFSGKAAPTLALPLLGGGKAALPQGKVTVVDFWATWCAPCRYSMPRLQSLWSEYRLRGVELYSVDTDDPGPGREAQVREFLSRERLSFPVALDDGTASQAFQVASLPTMLLVDRTGTVVWSHIGAFTAPQERQLRAALDRALLPP
jgi:cytochrome c biogenesis protein CcmG, thiol:disulfide interchange protein DsbE